MRIRILGLGNDLLGDDAFGLLAAQELGNRLGPEVDVRSSSTAGFDLLEDVAGATHLLVLDTLATGRLPAGTVTRFSARDLELIPGSAPHYVGLTEALALGRSLGLEMPSEIVILASEPADCLTVGGPMSVAVTGAVQRTVASACEVVTEWMAAGERFETLIQH
jgi:hydrogenase maturation protease